MSIAEGEARKARWESVTMDEEPDQEVHDPTKTRYEE
jgi:hypothetical protein